MKRIKQQVWAALGLLALLNVTGIVQLASGAVTPIAWYKLGEDDPGAVAGNPGNTTTVDSVGGFTLSRIVSPDYSADTPPMSLPGSSLSMKFDGAVGPAPYDAYVRTTPVTAAITGVGMEAWVKPSGTLGTQWIVNNGNNLDGYGFIIKSGDFRLNMPNAGEFVIAPAVADQWVHLGFTRDSLGVSRVYLNGVEANTSTLTPIVPGSLPPDGTSRFVLGDNDHSNPAGHTPFGGLIDQVRVFTFADGAFSPSDFLIATPEPSTALLLLAGGGLAWRRKKKVE